MARGKSTVTLETEIHGPFWKRKSEMGDALNNAVEVTAKTAETEVRSYLGSVLKNPTGAYQNAIHTAKRPGYGTIVGDGGVAYGPWLESGRTRGPGGAPRRTRFKGYAAFRKTRQKVARWLRKNGEAAVSAVAGRLN